MIEYSEFFQLSNGKMTAKSTDITNSLRTCTVVNTFCKCVILGFLFLGNLGLSII